jgi:hypothetical protein
MRQSRERVIHSQSWRAWASIAEPETTVALPGIAAVSPSPGKIDLVCWGVQESHPPPARHRLHLKVYWPGLGWQRTIPIGNPSNAIDGAPASTNTSLAVASWRVGFEYFLRGPDNTLWGRPWSQSQSGSLDEIGADIIDFTLTSGPAAVASPAYAINVIVRGPDNAFYHKVVLSKWPA